MTESNHPSAVASDEQTSAALLTTKVRIPRTRDDLITRPRLVSALDEAVERDVTLVCTPAGFGKTTALASWAKGTQRRVAWLALDEGDNDPSRFWRHIAAALHQERAPGNDSIEARPLQSAQALIAELAGSLYEDAIVLVLDDYHLIDSRTIHEGLAQLVERMPAGLRFVVSSRSDPALPLSRLRARGQLAELRATDLRFTSEEARDFLSRLFAVQLSDDAAAALQARTEGWAAGLQLAGLSLRDQPDPDTRVAAFSGTHRYVLDYFTQEVLEHLPEDVRTFLLDVSVLNSLCGPLCDAVTARDGGQQMLENLERANVFLVPVDDERHWYRFHYLFADLLRARALATSADHVSELHRRAAAWLAAHGPIDEAVRHASRGGDFETAAALVEGHAEGLNQHGEAATVRRWLTWLPEQVDQSRPVIAVARAVTALVTGETDKVEAYLDRAERAVGVSERSRSDDQATGWRNIPGSIAMLRAELAKQEGDAERTHRYALEAAKLAGEHDQDLLLLSNWNLAMALLMKGEVQKAEELFAEIVDLQRRAGRAYHSVRASYALSQALRAQGRLGAALAACSEGLKTATDLGGPQQAAAGVAHAGIAEILCERNELDEALRHARESVELSQRMVYFQWVVTSLATLSRVHAARGEIVAAMDTVEAARRPALRPETTVELINPLPVQRARLLLAQGEIEPVEQWLSRRGTTPADHEDFGREDEYLLLARVLTARGQSGAAQGLLQRFRSAAEGQGRTGSVLKILPIEALLHQSGDATAEAQQVVDRALRLGEPEGYVRVFADEGRPMATLLRQLGRRSARPSTEIPVQYVARILDAIPTDGISVEVARAELSGLTQRELEVLLLIAAGKRNREIADDLVVTVDTIKKHVSHIFDKLEVGTRSAAAARARELGLLADN